MQNLDNDLCQAVVTEAGKTIWLRGQCPQNLDDGVNLDSDDPAEQTRKVMENIKQLIEESGGEMKHLVKIVVYITDIRHRDAIYKMIGTFTKNVHLHASFQTANLSISQVSDSAPDSESSLYVSLFVRHACADSRGSPSWHKLLPL